MFKAKHPEKGTFTYEISLTDGVLALPQLEPVISRLKLAEGESQSLYFLDVKPDWQTNYKYVNGTKRLRSRKLILKPFLVRADVYHSGLENIKTGKEQSAKHYRVTFYTAEKNLPGGYLDEMELDHTSRTGLRHYFMETGRSPIILQAHQAGDVKAEIIEIQ